MNKRKGILDLQSETLQVFRVTLGPFLKLLEPTVQDIHGNNQLGPIHTAKRLHEIEQILSDLHRQPFDSLLRRHIKRRQRRQIFHRHADLRRKRLRVRRQLQRPSSAGLRPRECEDGGGARHRDGAAEDEGRSRRLDVDGERFLRREGEAVKEEDAEVANLVVRLACAR